MIRLLDPTCDLLVILLLEVSKFFSDGSPLESTVLIVVLLHGLQSPCDTLFIFCPPLSKSKMFPLSFWNLCFLFTLDYFLCVFLLQADLLLFVSPLTKALALCSSSAFSMYSCFSMFFCCSGFLTNLLHFTSQL